MPAADTAALARELRERIGNARYVWVLVVDGSLREVRDRPGGPETLAGGGTWLRFISADGVRVAVNEWADALAARAVETDADEAGLEREAREWLDAPKRALTWATVSGVAHAWDVPYTRAGDGTTVTPATSVCGKQGPNPSAWVSSTGDTRCPECARIEAEPLLALLRRHRGSETPPPRGHDEPCGYCGEPCDDLAGDPGKWSVRLSAGLVGGEPGKARWFHQRCVTERLEKSPTPRVDERMVAIALAAEAYVAACEVWIETGRGVAVRKERYAELQRLLLDAADLLAGARGVVDRG